MAARDAPPSASNRHHRLWPGHSPSAATELAPHGDCWRALVAVPRRIHDGERDPATVLPGLDPTNTAIAQRALDVLTGTATVDPDAWRPADQ